jgi:hypothetical protein
VGAAARDRGPARRAAFAVPGAAAAVLAAGLCVVGWAALSPALWSIAGIFAAGAFCFTGARRDDGLDWHRFESDFWEHVARHQEFHVADRD